MWFLTGGPGQRWWLLRSATVGSPSGSPAHPNAPEVRTPSRCAPGMSPSGRCVRGISSDVYATGSAPGPRPRARRSPPPPYDRGLERFSPQPGQPAQRSQDSMTSTRPHSRRATAIRWKPSKPTSRSHRSQRSSDTEQQQVG